MEGVHIRSLRPICHDRGRGAMAGGVAECAAAVLRVPRPIPPHAMARHANMGDMEWGTKARYGTLPHNNSIIGGGKITYPLSHTL